MAKLDATEILGQRHELRTSNERHALLETAINAFAHIEIVFSGDNSILGQQREERLLSRIVGLEFGHYLYPIARIERELIFDLKGAYRIDIVAKEIDTIRILATVREDIENRTTKSKLTWLVDIVDLREAQIAQLARNIANSHLIALLYY